MIKLISHPNLILFWPGMFRTPRSASAENATSTIASQSIHAIKQIATKQNNPTESMLKRYSIC